MSVSLTVLDVEMPSTASLRTHFILWSPSVCKAFTGERECSREDLYPLLSSFQRMGLEHRVTLSSQFDPQSVPDWATFDVWWSPFLEGTAPLRLPHARMTSVQFPGFQTPERLSDFATQVDVRGWLPIAFNFVADEPPYRARLRLIWRYLQLVGAEVPAFVEDGIPEPTVSAPANPDEPLRLAR